MTTPEGKVKANIARVLKSFGVYFFMPVQSGYGATGVDFHCVVSVNYHDFLYNGPNAEITKVPVAFFIEAKDKDKKPTPRQVNFLQDRKAQGCMVFVIDDDLTLQELVKWLEVIEEHNERTRALADGRRPNVGGRV